MYKAKHDTQPTPVLCLPCVHSTLPLISRTRSLTVVMLIMAMVLVAACAGNDDTNGNCVTLLATLMMMMRDVQIRELGD